MLPQFSNFKSGWYFPTLIAVILLVGIGFSFYIYNKVDTEGRNSLINRAETIARALDDKEVAMLLANEEDLSNPAYIDLKKKMIAIREANPDSRFIYIMGTKEGELFFYVDSEPSDSEDYSPPGEVYEDESPAFEAAFTAGISGAEGPIRDKWGNWITGVAPIYSQETDQVIGAVGIDVDAASYLNDAFAQSIVPILIACILSVFAYFGQQLRKKEQRYITLKSQFVALATHEIRSPLTGIVWSLGEFLKRETIHAKELEPIEKASEQLIESVNDILYSFSLETNQGNHEKVDLGEVIKNSAAILSSFAEKKEITIKLPELKEVYTYGDSNNLIHVFANLISNAIKYSPPGSVVLITESHTKSKISIVVRDKGIGIPQNDQKKVFEGFYRAPNAKKLIETGTGLGLYIVKKIVDNHNGKVRVNSDEGLGTTVEVELPLLS